MTECVKVGIVVVSYNASRVVRATLAAIRQARNRAPQELILVDNGSSATEFAAIAAGFADHASAMGSAWRLIRLEQNRGFAGGNNVGIEAFLQRQDISHICLLNGDVIVPDFWLDRLVEKGVGIISAVTNKADADQCVPVTYDLSLDECFTGVEEEIALACWQRVNEFAQFRYRTWRGRVVETDVTFFCVLLSVPIVRELGLLDEHFFPGAYEDNDYCLRAHARGIPVHLARDAFIHHWGSASFGQLDSAYFAERAGRNIRYLEQKHGIRLERHPENPLRSYAADMLPILSSAGCPEGVEDYHECFRRTLDPLVRHTLGELDAISAAVMGAHSRLPASLAEQMEAARQQREWLTGWPALAGRVAALLRQDDRSPALVARVTRDLQAVSAALGDVGRCNLAMHEFLQQEPSLARGADGVASSSPKRKHKRVETLRRVRELARFLWSLRGGVVVFAGYPYPERLSDGYFQRVRMIDRLLTDHRRVYVETAELPGRDQWIDRPEPDVLVLRVIGASWLRRGLTAIAVISALRAGRIYYHSVLRMRDGGFGRLIRVPWIRKVTDIHGVVPEEFRYHGDFYSGVLYDHEESLAARNSDLLVVVSGAMQRYFEQKYRQRLKAPVARLPMLPVMATYTGARGYRNGRPTVVYAGGTHKWQQIPKMIEAIAATVGACDHEVYCPEPEHFRQMLPENLRDRVIVERKEHHELMAIYERCHFGFLLREPVVVNQVACPTKAVEYLAKGVVPILDSTQVGDFVELGLRFVHLADFLRGRLPSESERNELARQNRAVLGHLLEARDQGAAAIQAVMGRGGDEPATEALRRFAGRLPPRDTRRGRLAGNMLHRSPKQSSRTEDSVPARFGCDPESVAECDLVMQVGNFSAGGLERVVLDLCDAMQRVKLRVLLLVLGEAGVATRSAMERAIPVVVLDRDAGTYETLLGRVRPRVVMSHYCTFGAAACSMQRIPFIQVIHNAYVWLSEEERAELAESVEHTSMFVAVSEYVRRFSIERLGLPASKCVVFPNGADIGQLLGGGPKDGVRSDTRRALGIGESEFVFLSVGSVNHQKNHASAIRAFASASCQMPGARLVILGPAHEQGLYQEMMTLLAERALSRRVIYAGAADSADSYYAAADAFVCASYFEGGQLSLLEALAANLPIITTRVGFACHLEGVDGVTIVEPPCDIWQFGGNLGELESSIEFVEALAAAMVAVYWDPTPPDLPDEILGAMSTAHATAAYVDLVLRTTEGGQVTLMGPNCPWPDLIQTRGRGVRPTRAGDPVTGPPEGHWTANRSGCHELSTVVTEQWSLKG